MSAYDYVIVGAGAAGCVLAYRLSENPNVRVALLEAGARDASPFIHMPKGLAKVMQDVRNLWAYPSRPEAATAMNSETWVRGRVLGGSSSVNGMMYVRGQPADFESLADLAGPDWGWSHIAAAYEAMECHELGAAPTRGGSGPLRISMPRAHTPLTDAMLAAGKAMGWPVKQDVNQPDDGEGVGYAPCTIHRGRRQSAATAFLKPAAGRPNLTVLTGATVDKVLFTGRRATGVLVRQGGQERVVEAAREVILCGGAMATPGILERSGIGDPDRLAALHIPLVHASPQVGEGLSEHRGLLVQWKLRAAHQSQNREYAGWRLVWAVARYFLTRTGPMAGAAYEMGAWFRTRPDLNRPDAQLLLAPFSLDFAKARAALEPFPGMHVVVYPLRPTSRGRIHITSTDPEVLASLEPNYRATEQDRAAMIGAVRTVRRFAAAKPLADFIVAETMPGPAYQTDAEILEAYDRYGTCGYHAVGSCRMGRDAGSVVDPELRVRGVHGLRIMDTSIMPVIPAGNTNGPTMAMAWRAADIIRRG